MLSKIHKFSHFTLNKMYNPGQEVNKLPMVLQYSFKELQLNLVKIWSLNLLILKNKFLKKLNRLI